MQSKQMTRWFSMFFLVGTLIAILTSVALAENGRLAGQATTVEVDRASLATETAANQPQREPASVIILDSAHLLEVPGPEQHPQPPSDEQAGPVEAIPPAQQFIGDDVVFDFETSGEGWSGLARTQPLRCSSGETPFWDSGLEAWVAPYCGLDPDLNFFPISEGSIVSYVPFNAEQLKFELHSSDCGGACGRDTFVYINGVDIGKKVGLGPMSTI